MCPPPTVLPTGPSPMYPFLLIVSSILRESSVIPEGVSPRGSHAGRGSCDNVSSRPRRGSCSNRLNWSNIPDGASARTSRWPSGMYSTASKSSSILRVSSVIPSAWVTGWIRLRNNTDGSARCPLVPMTSCDIKPGPGRLGTGGCSGSKGTAPPRGGRNKVGGCS